MDDELPICKNGEGHDIKVWFLKEEPITESYYMGVCMKCGLTMILHVNKIEEAFQHV